MERRITEIYETKKQEEGSSGLNFQKSVSAYVSRENVWIEQSLELPAIDGKQLPLEDSTASLASFLNL